MPRVPNAWDFYHVADNATQKDQDLLLSASIDTRPLQNFHNSVRYGLIRSASNTRFAAFGNLQLGLQLLLLLSGLLWQYGTITARMATLLPGKRADCAGTYPSGSA